MLKAQSHWSAIWTRLTASVGRVVKYVSRERLECLGAVCGAAGAFLLSQHESYSKWGWVGFLLSNVFLIAMARKKQLYGLMLVQAYFCYTSVNGIVHYF